MMRACATLLLFLAMTFPVMAQSVIDAESAAETSVTIYPDNLALITEVHRLELPKGRSTVRFLGVSDLIIPQSAVLRGFSGATIERNFDVDLISKSSLLSNSVGDFVTLMRVNKTTGLVKRQKAKIVSASPSTGVVFDINGKIETLQCSGHSEAVMFSALPDGLNAAPVLSMDVSSETGGQAELIMSYLTTGMSWAADYRLDANSDHKTGAILGWLTVENESSKTYKDIPLSVIAGELNRSDEEKIEDVQIRADVRKQSATCWPKGSTKTGVSMDNSSRFLGRMGPPGAPGVQYAMVSQDMEDEIIVTANKRVQATREDIGDYKLYRAPLPVSLNAMQTKQIAFLSKTDIEFERVFTVDFPFDKRSKVRQSWVEYRIDNTKGSQLAEPLPEGKIRVMSRRRNGEIAYLGEDDIKNSPIGVPVDLMIGASFAVSMQGELTSVSGQGSGKKQLSLLMNGAIFNATSDRVDAEVEFQQGRLRVGDISKSSHQLKNDEVIPTLQVRLAPESVEKFSVELDVKAAYIFDFDNVDIDEYDLGKIQHDDGPEVQYVSASLRDLGNWVSSLFPPPDDLNIQMRSTLLSYVEAETDDGHELLEISMKHVFVNEDDSSAAIIFKMNDYCSDDLKLLRSNQEPNEDCPYLWRFELEPGQEKTLTYTASSIDF